MESIIQHNKDRCYLCKRWLGGGGETHHVFGGPLRKASERYGLKVRLCHWCHNEPPYGVHHNAENRHRLQAEAQKIFEQTYSRELFIETFGRDWT